MSGRLLLVCVLTMCSLIGATNASAQIARADLQGHVWYGDTPLCALVIANGQSVFTCNPRGPFELLSLPLNANGQIEVQVFAAGFAPFKQAVTPTGTNPLATLPRIEMVREKEGRAFQIQESFVRFREGDRVRVGGSISIDDVPVCGLILANGQKMFSCGDNLGIFSFDVPLDAANNISLQAFAAGFQPFKKDTLIDIDSLPACVDIAGIWQTDADLTLTCRADGVEQTDRSGGGGLSFVEQSGCSVDFNDDSLLINIDGNRLSGSLVIPPGSGVVFSDNEVPLRGTVIGDSRFTLVGDDQIRGRALGVQVTCDVDIVVEYYR